ncbi:MAG: succinylglutamate desuccinylase/aspartoacylase family protein [Myxococcales bacterium]|nr:succinylglutamate desuccinylase/aspartoacylase family protein [Myxococcales bacterium]MCB9693908.1 succinylglutamate desuccinylase/aspartoacylase family protein [Alphaproteobacteria bacterium]
MKVLDELDLPALPTGRVSHTWIRLAEDGFGEPECIPVIVARGSKEGPTVGLTAALHGNELNGIPVLHRLFERLDCSTLRGNVVGVLAANVPGYHHHRRIFVEGMDLNHRFPGRPDGNAAEVVTHNLTKRVIRHFDALLDLHTASFGRENCLYVRANMSEERTARMAFLQRPQLIVHNPPNDLTLRGAAAELGIPAITVEIGDSHRFQERYIKRTLVGVRAVLMELGLIPKRPLASGPPPVMCRSSSWVYTEGGGLLTVVPRLVETVAEGEIIARRVDIFGKTLAEVRAPRSGVVIGRSTQPVARTGSRILHLGDLALPTDTHILGHDRGAKEILH